MTRRQVHAATEGQPAAVQPQPASDSAVDLNAPMPPMTVGEFNILLEAHVAQARAQDASARASSIIQRIHQSVARRAL